MKENILSKRKELQLGVNVHVILLTWKTLEKIPPREHVGLIETLHCATFRGITESNLKEN